MSYNLETISDYYRNPNHTKNYALAVENYECGKSHFNINLCKFCGFKTPFNRRDYYKVSFIIGTGELKYGTHSIIIDKPALFLPCPTIPFEWKCISSEQSGYFCLFNQEFLNEHISLDIFKKSSLFKEWSNPLIFLEEEQVALTNTYFKHMYEMAASDYSLKFEMIKNLLSLLLHQALQLKVEDADINSNNSFTRIYRLFDDLLNQQFPLDSPAYPLQLKKPIDFANYLNIHVNHLNASIKKATNKTTSQLIKARILNEAKNLLFHTNWDIAEVGYTLGFEQPSYFNNFFKKLTKTTPKQFRISYSNI